MWYGHPSHKNGNPYGYVNPYENGLMTIPNMGPPVLMMVHA